METETLRLALSKATEDNMPLSSHLVSHILKLNELMEKASAEEDAPYWIQDTQEDIALPAKAKNRHSY